MSNTPVQALDANIEVGGLDRGHDEDEIRQLVAGVAEREGISVSVEVDRGQVTLRGDVLCQRALGEIADSLLSIATITQIHTRLSTP